MAQSLPDLQQEQLATLARPRYLYSWVARIFFWGMDLATGKPVTLAKARLLEILACVPYREWESLQYARMTADYCYAPAVRKAQQIAAWSRAAQDNEYWHLLVLNEKMKEDGVKDPWYLFPPLPGVMALTYRWMAWWLARMSLRGAFLFNAQFEDHAEHVYAQFVQEHPEWETQPLTNALVRQYAAVPTWADVFRRIGLDERDHMNHSFAFCGQPERIVRYAGMPPESPR